MKRFAPFLVAGFVLAAGCSSGGGRPEVAAVVEGVEIASADTEGLVDAYLRRQKAEQQKQELPRHGTVKLVLAYQIKVTFLEHLAKEMRVSSEPKSYFDAAADVIEPETYEAIGLRPGDFARSLQAGQLSKAIAEKLYPNVSVSENALREEYERRAPELERSWKATTRIARFSTEEPAGKVRERVRSGEAFEAAAKELGAERVAAVEINPIVASLPPGVLDAVGAVAPGEVTEGVPAADGWLSILVETREDVPRPTFEELREELTDVVAEQQRAALFHAWFEKKFAKAKVEVDGHYGKWNAKFATVT